MTEVPEHLLARSRAVGRPWAAEATSRRQPAEVERRRPRSRPRPSRRPPPVAAAAALARSRRPGAGPAVGGGCRRRRKRIPFWAVPVLASSRSGPSVYMVTLDKPTDLNSPVTIGADVVLHQVLLGLSRRQPAAAAASSRRSPARRRAHGVSRPGRPGHVGRCWASAGFKAKGESPRLPGGAGASRPDAGAGRPRSSPRSCMAVVRPRAIERSNDEEFDSRDVGRDDFEARSTDAPP